MSECLKKGTNTKTPELKISGQPTSGAAESSGQQCNLVKVTPSSGLWIRAKLASSLLSKTSTIVSES
uniref:Uncharacterized protein n=1 Tax=Romanomermis culicivorax TaxID=13658 RepID=A0A915JI77_ROMCU